MSEEPKFTPGPWAWFGQGEYSLYLGTTDRGRLTVMGFRRYGMKGAQPTFAVGRALVPAADLMQFEVGDPSVVGLTAARGNPSVYRYDVRGLSHPDAILIAAAPDLYAALDLARQVILECGVPPHPEIDAALAKARGE